MAQLPILYSFRRCPFAMRARMALRYSGIRVEHREVLLKDKPESMLTASPKGTVPVLVFPDQAVLEESLDIMLWALGQADPDGWLNTEPATQQQRVQRFDLEFKPQLDRYKYHNHQAEEDWLPARSGCVDLLVELEAQLSASPASGHPVLQGAKLSYADVAIMPFVRQFANVDNAWFAAQPLPAVHRWLDTMLSSALFIAVMQKYPAWQPANEALLVP